MEILPVTSRFLLPFTKSITLPTGSNVKQVSDLVRKVNRGLKELCREHSAQLVPTYGLFVSEQGEASRDLMQAGGYYVNIFGYGKIADGIHAELKKLSGNKGSLDSRL